MNKLFLFFGLILFGHSFGQSIEQITVLETNLWENSGILIADNQIILHNDGGNSPSIYSSDINNVNFQECAVGQTTNTDWEDICSDNQSVFIGDFGNNLNNRQDLKILKIPRQSVLDCTISQVEQISFSYPDQNNFPPNDNNLRFDAEALISFNDSLYIFTKDRTNPYLGKTWVYSLPKTTGNHTANLVDSFELNESSLLYSITGASISPDQSQLALINSNSVFLFSNLSNNSFFDGDLQIIPLGTTQQFEAVEFLDNNILYFSCEKSILGDAKLFKLDLSTSGIEETLTDKIDVLVKNSTIEISNKSNYSQKINVKIVDSMGKLLQSNEVNLQSNSKEKIHLENRAGIYFLHVESNHFSQKTKIILSAN